MPMLSKYEDAAQALLSQYPVGSLVGPDDLINWATEHGNGLAADLLIGDPGKKIGALRRHLNHGGASRNLAEEKRFYLDMEDVKRKTMVVKALAEHTAEQAEASFGKSMLGAISPLKRAQRAIDDVKLDELSTEMREELEQQLQELVATAEPLRNLLSKQNIDRHAKRLEAKGYTPQQARDLLEMMPTFTRFQKLQRAIS